MRYAIWIAVSTEAQAGSDKDSLPEQEKRCRAAGQAKSWIEVGLYSAPGESRTRYVNLRDAEDEIPQLHQLLEDGKAGLMDVVMLYDYNRLRDLLDPVAKALSSYGVQLYSVNQPVEPLDPEQFNPYASDAESMMRGMNQIVSRWQIADLRRKHTFGVMSRVRRGLHPSGRAPYGYQIREKNLVLNPAQAAIAIEIKDLYLSGLGVPQIMARLAEKRVLGPRRGRWSDYGIRYILRNPVYCGTVRLGYFRTKNDPRAGKSKLVRGDPSKILTGAGRHQPLWDEDTHLRILAEMKRRHRRHKGQKTYRLSNLLQCAEHGKALRVHYLRGLRDDAHRVWYCSALKRNWHVMLKDAEILPRISDRLVADLRTIGSRIEVTEEKDDTGILTAARDDLARRRERLADALEMGGLDPRTYAVRVEALDVQLREVEDKLGLAEGMAATRERRGQNLQAIAELIQSAPDVLLRAPAQEINQQLRNLVEKIVVRDGDFEIDYR